MKVIKKFKRLANSGRSSNQPHSSSNLPPLGFHSTHGENIQISNNALRAQRVESFCKGIVFSNRAVAINERIFIKFVELSSNWSGTIRFGFTSNDPAKIHTPLPKYACPDLALKPGNWAKALGERLVNLNSLLYYYVTEHGDVCFGIDEEEKGIFFSGVDTSVPLWALIDIYGNSTALEFVELRPILNNNRVVRNPEVPLTLNTNAVKVPQKPPQAKGNSSPSGSCMTSSVYFHSFHGIHINLSSDRLVASRTSSYFVQGYSFTGRPLNQDEVVILQIEKVNTNYVGSLVFGLTNCDPDTLQQSDLPDDSDNLIDRPEYWIVKKDIAEGSVVGDKFAFRYLGTGEVQLSKNQGEFSTLMYVDTTQELWAFFNLYGATQQIKLKEIRSPTDEMSNLINAFEVCASTSDGTTRPEKPRECVICFDSVIDSVMYSCGHSCTCLKCGKNLLRNGGAQCPICRQKIQDVIRLFPS